MAETTASRTWNLTGFNPQPDCRKCGGRGYLPHFAHVDSGRCWACAPEAPYTVRVATILDDLAVSAMRAMFDGMTRQERRQWREANPDQLARLHEVGQ